ncbi:expressed conserved protein [Echinococcus multilocularis]|uniref:Expressed conserved protein n=1 Tax=Echinococcus multilocularis TaxID=6211 RepID=A0A087W1D4_ECHMU|nr:expressed conserved protein [Echinococcus multilocularis]
MVFYKKKQRQINDGVDAQPSKSKSLQSVRSGIHRNSNILLILLHSLFPLAIGVFLIAQEALASANNTPRSGVLGYLTGSGGILLQLTLIARTVVPSNVARFMDMLTICVAVIQFLSCTVGAFIVLAVVRKIYLVFSVSLANAIFCILPIFLAATSIMGEQKASESVGDCRNKPPFASSRLRSPFIVKGGSNWVASHTKTNKLDGLGDDVSAFETQF